MGKHSRDSVSARQAEGPPEIPLPNFAKKVASSAWGIPCGSDAYHASSDASLFSSSLPVLPHAVNFTDSEHYGQSVEENLPISNKVAKEDGRHNLLEDFETNMIGKMLPDDEEELLAGIMGDFDLNRLPSQLEDLDDNDLFGSGGGFEMDFEPQESLNIGMSKISISDGVASNGIGLYALSNGVGTVAGEHLLSNRM